MIQNSNIQFGWPYPKRKDFLTKLVESGKGEYNFQIKFQGSNITLPVFKIQLDLPKYRLSNGRTQAAQEEYLAKHSELGCDFFTRDLESEEAQTIQHQLLWKMVEGTPLYSYFKNVSNSQDEPLILTGEGFVVNGNRRLCAIRELYCGAQEKYGHFAHIQVVILPVCTPRDIDELEAYLQIQPDIREDYSWIAKACMLRARQLTHGYSYAELAVLYDIQDKDIQNIFAQLELVDNYLTSREKERQYNLVEQNDYAFKQLQKGRQQIKQADEKDLFTQISYVLIDNPDTVKGRLYERIPEVKENLQAITDQLRHELPIEEQIPEQTANYELFGVNQSVTSLEPVIYAVSKPENREILIEVVTDVIERQKEENKQRSKANAVFKEVSDANTHLKTALNYLTDDANKHGLEEQLNAIEHSVGVIREWISENA